MADQAKVLGCSVSYISAIERGIRKVPDDYVGKIVAWLELSENEARELHTLSMGARRAVRIAPSDNERALAASEFATVINKISAEKVRELRRFLVSDQEPRQYSTEDIKKCAELVRTCFELAGKLSFDLISIIENKLAQIEPKYFLQVDPTDNLGNQIAAYADTLRTVQKIVLSSHIYEAAHQQTPDGRFIAAHEIGHWMLHPQKGATFQRYKRSRIQEETEADLFARNFLMPESIARQFASPNSLAAACNVPSRQAEFRLKELGMWPPVEERDRVGRKFSNLLSELRNSPTTGHPQTAPKDAQIIPFPPPGRTPAQVLPENTIRKRGHQRATRQRKSAELPLLAFIEQKRLNSPRSDASKTDYMAALDALNFYSGHHKEPGLQSKHESESTKQISQTIRRDIDWYRRYGWRA